MRISDWSSDVCSSDLLERGPGRRAMAPAGKQVVAVQALVRRGPLRAGTVIAVPLHHQRVVGRRVPVEAEAALGPAIAVVRVVRALEILVPLHEQAVAGVAAGMAALARPQVLGDRKSVV